MVKSTKKKKAECMLTKFSLVVFYGTSTLLGYSLPKQELYGHLPPITKTLQISRTRHAGHCWRSKDELISDVILWTPSHGRAKAGRPAQTYIEQLCEDTGCSSQDPPKAMNDREMWRERVRYIRADGTIIHRIRQIFRATSRILT